MHLLHLCRQPISSRLHGRLRCTDQPNGCDGRACWRVCQLAKRQPRARLSIANAMRKIHWQRNDDACAEVSEPSHNRRGGRGSAVVSLVCNISQALAEETGALRENNTFSQQRQVTSTVMHALPRSPSSSSNANQIACSSDAVPKS